MTAQSRTGYSYVIADVFTDRAFTGNPLAVFTDARGLDGATMQTVARELNLSETVFLLPPDDPRHTRRARIFTPKTELPFAGHPTVGAAVVLAETGDVTVTDGGADIVLEEGVGPVPVRIERQPGDGVTRATLSSVRLPEGGPAPADPATLAAMLGLSADQVAVDRATGAPLPIATWGAGVSFTVVPVRDVAALSAARLDVAAWRRTLADGPAPQLYVLTMEDWRAGREVRTRMFAPAMGIEEDPATGSAAAALPGFLSDHQALADGEIRWHVHQGEAMGRPSLIEVTAEIRDGRPVAVRIGGGAVIVGRGEFLIPT